MGGWSIVEHSEAGQAGLGGLTCRILQRSDRQSMSSQGWYMPSVTQFNRITSMLTHSNHVHIESRTKLWGRGTVAIGGRVHPGMEYPPIHHKHIQPLWVPSLNRSMSKFSKTLEPPYPHTHNRHGHTCKTFPNPLPQPESSLCALEERGSQGPAGHL